tara:strand:+ start:534 stop:716 length:183 start_codon:yes stop_codon:yes gene_type:complete
MQKKPELVVLAIGADGAAARGSVERLDKILMINKKDVRANNTFFSACSFCSIKKKWYKYK